MEIVRLKMKDLLPNAGQIEGLPVNPRQWTRSDIDKIAASLRQTPELFEARPIIVTPHDGKYVILGGNLRYEGARANKDTDAPCIVVPEGTPPEKLKEIVIKDNGSFGAWDFDALANEWDDLPLTDWGVPAWNTEDDEPLDASDEGDDNYSRKIEVPIYEPTGEDVPIKECTDKAKYLELVAEIDAEKDLSKEERAFLKDAAGRHIIFNYARIADFYANARPAVQRLMEKSALVIIDFDKAMENGFITMAHKIADIYTNDYDEE